MNVSVLCEQYLTTLNKCKKTDREFDHPRVKIFKSKNLNYHFICSKTNVDQMTINNENLIVATLLSLPPK